MQTCTVKLSFCAAKRLPDFAGKCQYVHGYGHQIEATFAPKDGDDNEMVIDFYVIKQKLGDWLDDNWDHTILLHKKDKPLGDSIAEYTGQKPFYFDKSPTAEIMAGYIVNDICPQLFPDVKCVKVRVYDSPDAWVEV